MTLLWSLNDIVSFQPFSAAIATEALDREDAVHPLVNPGVSWAWSRSIPDTLALFVSKADTQVHAFGLASEVVFVAHPLF
ncbi:hypothetical protein CCUS01_02675 [Colletotrichum cuscutae]|uniref:Uncharacterized protein n=1 Tax=Colletotrichum cuscutae TaxID=1209917 RepID=A0AAI9YDI8_9PEZI|nr:hypothetical protein CCUS01_02675 [Colletotrichum cuscutae]